MKTQVAVSLLATMVALSLGTIVRADLVESWENSANGWSISPFGSQSGNFQISGFSNSTGVTDGGFSMMVGSTPSNAGSGPNYSQLLISDNVPTDAYSMNVTNLLANASNLSFDVFTPPGSFGFFLQFDVDINNSATGFVSLDGFSYQSVSIGGESTITVPITAAQQALLAGSGSGTTIILQAGGGFTAGNETFFIDNLRTTAIVPEPASWLLACFALACLVCGRLKYRRTMLGHL
jgi:hypothetical protein